LNFIAVDLGTTNIKVGCYDETLIPLAMESLTVEYLTEGERVEFSAEKYFNDLVIMLRQCASKAEVREISRIVLTGQAES